MLRGLFKKWNEFCELAPEDGKGKRWSTLQWGLNELGSSGKELTFDMLVIDTSASMMDNDYPPSRLDGAKQAAKAFVQKRLEVDTETAVGLVSFWESAALEHECLFLNNSTASLCAKIDGLALMPGTNIVAGLRKAYDALRGSPRASKKCVTLLTDGFPTHNDSLMVPTAEKLKKEGIQLDIIGIGGSPLAVNEQQLRKMASVVNGEVRYWFIGTTVQLVQKFEALGLRKFN